MLTASCVSTYIWGNAGWVGVGGLFEGIVVSLSEKL